MADICVYLSAKPLADKYQQLAIETGTLIGQRGHRLVYGGSNLGTMGTVAQAARDAGAQVKGVVPEIFKHRAHEFRLDDLQLVEDLRIRRGKMALSDAFITLPGAMGTFAEVTDIIEESHLIPPHRPVAIVNAFGYFDHLLAQYEHAMKEGASPFFLPETVRVVQTPLEAMEFIESRLGMPLRSA